MTDSEASALLDRFNVSRESRAKIEVYVKLLLTWQQRINLIGPATVESVWERHICDSLQLLPLLPPGTTTLAELGSGAGIPGLVLAMAVIGGMGSFAGPVIGSFVLEILSEYIRVYGEYHVLLFGLVALRQAIR